MNVNFVYFTSVSGEGRVGSETSDSTPYPLLGYLGYLGKQGGEKNDLSDPSGADFKNPFATDVYENSNRCV